MTWNIDPILVVLGPFTVRWYGFFFAIAFYAGYFIMLKIYKLEDKPRENLGTLFLTMMAATVIGARLGHCLFYTPGYYLSDPLKILRVWEGGLASHGGAIGITLGLWFYSRLHPTQPYLWLLDRIVIPIALAGSFIRFGNFFNSEIVGEPTQVPWGIIFGRIDAVPRHPVQLYESFAYLMVFVVLLMLYRKQGPEIPAGRFFGLFFILVFSARFLLEFVKTQQATYTLPVPLSVGQLLSIPAVLIGAWLFKSSLKSKALSLCPQGDEDSTESLK